MINSLMLLALSGIGVGDKPKTFSNLKEGHGVEVPSKRMRGPCFI